MNLYERLSQGSIRVIRILGTCLVSQPGRPQDLAIECSLETVRFADVRHKAVKYSALSYVWGSDRFPRWIVCNGVRFSVTSNLYDALWHLAFGESCPELLWVDAVCINQSDNIEKGQQVALMVDIYREADKVVVWLGTDAAANRDFQNFWSKLSSLGPDGFLDEDNELLVRGTTFLNQADWMQRLWTLQEIVLARDAQICCGFYRVNWLLLATMYNALLRGGRAWPDAEWIYRQPVVSGFAKIQQLRDTSVRFSLYELLQMTSHRRATQLHDRVYAVQGLWQGHGRLYPNYDQSYLQTYADTTLAIFEEEGWLWLNLKNIPPLQYSDPSDGLTPSCYEEDTNQLVHFVPPTVPAVSWIPNLDDLNRPPPMERSFDRGFRFKPAIWEDWGHQGPGVPEPRFSNLHPTFVPRFTLRGLNLLARGVIVGVWSQVNATGREKWHYNGTRGVFQGFPPCVADTTAFEPRDAHSSRTYPQRDPRSWDQDADPISVSPVEVHELLLVHITSGCKCDQPQSSQPPPSAGRLSRTRHRLAAALGRNRSSQPSSSNSTPDLDPDANNPFEFSAHPEDIPTNFAWLCTIFGAAYALVLRPHYNPVSRTITFSILSRLPQNHYWAAQIFRAGTFDGLSEENSPWYRWTMYRHSPSELRWFAELDKIDQSTNGPGVGKPGREIGNGNGDGSVELPAAFRRGKERAREAGRLRELARSEFFAQGYYTRVPLLERCHLNWIPAELEVRGDVSGVVG